MLSTLNKSQNLRLKQRYLCVDFKSILFIYYGTMLEKLCNLYMNLDKMTAFQC